MSSRGRPVVGTGIWASLGCALLILGGCAAVQQLARMEKPQLRLASTRIESLGFDGADLVFDVEVKNSNPLPLTLSGVEYDLALGDRPFLQGRREQGLEVAAGGQALVELPLSLDFGDLYAALGQLGGRDRASYRLEAGLLFDVPVLGALRLPLKASGQVPLPKKPAVGVEGLRVERLGLGGADLALELKLSNPNAFGLALKRLDYALAIDGDTWAAGHSERPYEIAAGAQERLSIPLRLDFGRMGMTAYRLLSGAAPLRFKLTGQLDLGTTLELLPHARLPLDLEGQLPLLR